MVRHDAAPTQSDNLAPCGQVDRRCRELHQPKIDQEVYLELYLVHLFNLLLQHPDLRRLLAQRTFRQAAALRTAHKTFLKINLDAHIILPRQPPPASPTPESTVHNQTS